MFSAISANKRNTAVLILVFVMSITAVAAWVGFVTENWWIPGIALGFVVGYTALQYRFAAREAIALAGGVELTRADNPSLWTALENLSIREGLPMPRLFLIPDAAPNAMAAGTSPDRAVVGVTTGLLELLDRSEVEAVLAHEIGHIKNYDIRVKTVVFGLLAAVGIIAYAGWAMAGSAMASSAAAGARRNPASAVALGFGALGLVVGLVASSIAHVVGPVIRSAISRQREYLADVSAVETTRYPEGLIGALRKLDQAQQPMGRPQHSSAHLFFTNPVRGIIARFLTATHPPIKKRIERLERMRNSLA